MFTKKFLTKLLDSNYRKTIASRFHKHINSPALNLKQYATYVVDKHAKERNEMLAEVKSAFYGYSPIDFIAYVSKDGSVKKMMCEFNVVNHFLKDNDHDAAVEAMTCALAQLVDDLKKDVVCFDIYKINAEFERVEAEYTEKMKKAAEDAAKTDEGKTNEH